jgi:NAD-dependent deacetylase
MSHPSEEDDASPPSEEALERAQDRLRDADHVLVLTGAGISVASGMPTFRGEEGLWKEHRPQELATPEAFARDPRLVWEWYAWRRRKARECAPNAAHRWLARWCLADPGVALLTQNVDDLHRRALEEEATAGVPEGRAPVELHGNLFRSRCTDCGQRRELRDPVDASSRGALPRCHRCGGLLRPDVVWFGESLDGGVLDEALSAARRADACLVVGTSAVVQPAASLVTGVARRGAPVVEVNPESTPVSRLAGAVLRVDAARAVPALLRPLLEEAEA